jgi:hypothetical protein
MLKVAAKNQELEGALGPQTLSRAPQLTGRPHYMCRS